MERVNNRVDGTLKCHMKSNIHFVTKCYFVKQESYFHIGETSQKIFCGEKIERTCLKLHRWFSFKKKVPEHGDIFSICKKEQIGVCPLPMHVRPS